MPARSFFVKRRGLIANPEILATRPLRESRARVPVARCNIFFVIRAILLCRQEPNPELTRIEQYFIHNV